MNEACTARPALRSRPGGASVQLHRTKAFCFSVLLLGPACTHSCFRSLHPRRIPGRAAVIEHLNWPATSVFLAFFALVTILGFVAARWKAGDLDHLHEWGLGGRRFGSWVSWFLIGGDLYTAYTVIAVPALVYAVGAFGFFAIPYTIIIYPFLFLAFPRLWSIAQ